LPITLNDVPSKAPAKRKRLSRKAQPKTKGFDPVDCKLDISAEPIRNLVDRVAKSGGAVVGAWKDPLGGSPLVIAVLPLEAVEPTPFQRDLS
jgi:ParB family chromosome partitioning protein